MTEQAETPDVEAVEAAPAAEEAELVEQTQPDPEPTEEPTDEPSEEPEETVEIAYGGQKFEVPKSEYEAMPEILRDKLEAFTKETWAAHTRNQQENAEARKSLQEAEKHIARLNTLSQDAMQAYAEARSLEAQLAQFSRVDMDEMWRVDPDRARQLSDQYGRLQQAYTASTQRLERIEEDQDTAQTQARAQAEQAGRERVLRRIPSFEKDAPAVIDYVAKSYGVDEAEAQAWGLNPAAAEMAWKAWHYDQLKAKSAAQKKTSPPTKPVTGIKAKGSQPAHDLVRDADKMSAEEWAKRRNKQESERRRRR